MIRTVSIQQEEAQRDQQEERSGSSNSKRQGTTKQKNTVKKKNPKASVPKTKKGPPTASKRSSFPRRVPLRVIEANVAAEATTTMMPLLLPPLLMGQRSLPIVPLCPDGFEHKMTSSALPILPKQTSATTKSTSEPEQEQQHSPIRRHLNRITFPHKLFNLLESGMYPEVISWTASGTTFCIWERQALEETVLPQAGFDLSKLRSFHRQLSFWGFVRRRGGIIDPKKEGRNKEWKPEVWEHPSFIQGMHRDGLRDVVRVVAKTSPKLTMKKKKKTTTTSMATKTTTKKKENKDVVMSSLPHRPVTPDSSPIKTPVLLDDRPAPRTPKTRKTKTPPKKRRTVISKSKKTKPPSKKKIITMKPQDKKETPIVDDSILFPTLFDGEEDVDDEDEEAALLLPPSCVQRRISFQESDFEEALDLFTYSPPDFNRGDSCSSALSFISTIDCECCNFLVDTRPIRETTIYDDRFLTDIDIDMIEEI